jgi:hypothetical protein
MVSPARRRVGPATPQCYKLVHNHPESLTPVRLQRQRTGRKHTVDMHVIQRGSADRQAEPANICRRVDASIMFWQLQSVIEAALHAAPAGSYLPGTHFQRARRQL